MHFPSFLSLTNTYHTMTEANKYSMQFIVPRAYGISPGAFLMSKALPWSILNTPTSNLLLISVMILTLERQVSHMMTSSSVTTWQIRCFFKSVLLIWFWGDIYYYGFDRYNLIMRCMWMIHFSAYLFIFTWNIYVYIHGNVLFI